MKLIKYLLWFIVAIFLGLLAKNAQGQDTTFVNQDVTIFRKDGNQRMLQVQPFQNYQDESGTWHPWKLRIEEETTPTARYAVGQRWGNKAFRAGIDSSIWMFRAGPDSVTQRLINPRKETASWQSDQVLWKNTLKATDVYLTTTSTGVKETIILRNAQSPDSIRFEIVASQQPIMTEVGVQVGGLFMPTPTAMDAKQRIVAVSWAWALQPNGTYLVTVVAATAGATYPITIDPTISLTVGATGSYQVRNRNAVYLTSRNGTSGDYAGVQSFVGQLTADFEIKRLVFNVAVPSFSTDTMAIDSMCILGTGVEDGSVTNFTANIYSANVETGIAAYTGAFNDFDGWQASGAYTGTTLGTFNSVNYLNAGANRMRLTAGGQDTVLAHRGDTLNTMIVSAEDVAASQPGADEYLGFTSATMALEIWYVYQAPTIVSGGSRGTIIYEKNALPAIRQMRAISETKKVQ